MLLQLSFVLTSPNIPYALEHKLIPEYKRQHIKCYKDSFLLNISLVHHSEILCELCFSVLLQPVKCLSFSSRQRKIVLQSWIYFFSSEMNTINSFNFTFVHTKCVTGFIFPGADVQSGEQDSMIVAFAALP